MEKPTDEKCERCGSPLVIKWASTESFYACSSYDKENPESCTFTKENPINLPIWIRRNIQETTQEEYCRELRPGHGPQAGPLRPVYGLHRLSDCKTTRPRSRQEGPGHPA